MKLERILYVEDDMDIQLIARIALEKVGGFTVEICSSGQEALTKVPIFQPQLVLLDVMMPDMDGPTTLNELRKLPVMNNIPVIFLTAKSQSREIESYQSLGVVGTIVKPFDPMSLHTSIHKLWEQRIL